MISAGTSTPNLREILSHFENVEGGDGRFTARCPSHDDARNSLSISQADGGSRVLMKCHAGCTFQSIIKAAGLEGVDLGSLKSGRREMERPASPGRIVAEYNYTDEDGQLLFQAVRLDPKDFRQRQPNGNGGWTWKLNGVRQVPYRLPEIIAADPAETVYVCEGEKDADRLAALGLVATCNAGGALKWRTEFAEHLSGRRVVILPDADEPGRRHAEDVAGKLRLVAASIKVVALPGLPEKGDASDWLDQGHTVEELRRLVDAAAEWGEPKQVHAVKVITSRPIRKLTDLGNAERFVDQHADKFRYEPIWGKSLVWDGRRWEIGDDTAGLRLAMETARSIYLEAAAADDHAIRAALSKHAVASESRARLQSMVTLAEAKLTISHKELDRHPYLFNCANGILDLRTGELLAHDPGLYLTQTSTVEFDPSADCPTFKEFVGTIFNKDADLISWNQRCLGYSLSGLTVEQILVIFHGSGANGKSTLLNVMQDVLGDYAGKAPPSLLMAKKNDAHPTELTTLFRKRFVAAVETEAGRKLAEATVKELTGGDAITARRVQEDFWTFNPTHKLVLCTNHKPVITGNDHAIWRRIKLVPFTVKISPEKQDKHLGEKLHAERSGILNWLLDGWRQYQESGLGSCKVIDEATAEYKAAEDVFSEFLAEHCTLDKQLDVKASAIVSRYTAWARENGHEEMTGKQISEHLTTNLGLRKKRNDGIRYYGIGLKAEENNCYPDY